MKKIFSKLGIFEYLLVLFCLFQAAINIVWINLNKLPFPWDQAGHTIIAYRFLDFFQGKPSVSFFSISDYYPPLTHIIVAILMGIFGREPNIGALTVTGFYLTSLVFLYLLAKRLFKSGAIAFFAVLLFSLFPLTYNLSRYFLLELPVTAMILASLYFLDLSNNFTNRRATYLFAVTAGLALMVKWIAGVYLFVPVLLNLYFAYKRNILKDVLQTLYKSAAILLGITLFWYYTNLDVLRNATKITTTAEISDPQVFFSVENIIYYFHQITNFLTTWPGMIAFLISVPALIKNHKRISLFLLGAYVFSYFIFTIIGNKDLRYVFPLAPITALVISYGFIHFLKVAKIYTLVLAIALLIFYFNYFFSLSFGFPIDPVRDDIRRTSFLPILGGIDIINLGKDSSYYLAPKYSATVWPNKTIAEELSHHDPNHKIKILIISEKPFFNQVNMELARRQINQDKIEFFAPYEIKTGLSEDGLVEYLNNYSLVLVAKYDLGPQGGIRHIDKMVALKSYLEGGKSTISEKINQYFLPDGDTLEVYKISQWPTQTIVSEMSKHNPSKQVKVLMVVDKKQLNAVKLESERKTDNQQKIQFFGVNSTDLVSADMATYLKQYDVVMVADKDVGGVTLDEKQALSDVKEEVESGLNPNILKINTYFLPDGDTLSVYKVQ